MQRPGPGTAGEPLLAGPTAFGWPIFFWLAAPGVHKRVRMHWLRAGAQKRASECTDCVMRGLSGPGGRAGTIAKWCRKVGIVGVSNGGERTCGVVWGIGGAQALQIG